MAVQRYRRSNRFRKYARRGVKLVGAAAAARYGTTGGFKRLVDDVAYVKSKLNSELKYVDRDLTDIPTTTATVRSINLLAQGDGGSQRDGQQVRFKSCNIRGTIGWNSAASGPIVTRLCLVLDTMPQGTTPAYSAAAGSPCVFEASDPEAFRRLDSTHRFKILWSRRIVVDSTYPLKRFSLYKKMSIVTKYFAGITSGTSAAVMSNGLFFMCVSDQAVNGPGLDYSTRMRFIDN